MTMVAVFDLLVCLLIVGVAVWTIAARDNFAAVVGYVVYGLLLALAWMRLSAPDIALTEAAIGGGLTGVLLIRAAARLRACEAASLKERPGPGLRVAAALLAGAVALLLAGVVLTLPEPAPTLAPQVDSHIATTGLGNAVTAVLLAFRATDTLLEAVVLVFALIAVWSMAPDSAWGGRPGPRIPADPHGILSYMARLLPPFGIVIAIYLFWVGADLPGGKFQAGTLLAAMWLLVMMAGLVDAPAVSRRLLRVGLVTGTVVFLGIGLAGIAWTGTFLAYPEGYAKPLILVIEAASMLSIAITLGLLVAGSPERPEPP